MHRIAGQTNNNEILVSGLEKLEAQQAKMTDATMKLLFVVSAAG